MLVSYPDVLSPGGGTRQWVGGPAVGGGPGAAPAQLAALWARDPARRDIGGWGRGRRGGAKAALVMIQLAWPRSLQPLLGIVAGLFGSCRALWSVWCLQPGPVGGFAALGAVLRRVVGVSWLYWCNSPRG